MTDLATPPRFLDDIYDAASECNKCGLCQAACPTYAVNPVEWETARGRISLIRDAIEGRIELRDLADGPLSTCLTCDCCVAACPPAVPTAAIVSRARQELHEQDGHSRAQTVALRTIFARPAYMRLLHGLSRAAQVTGLHGLARRSGITAWLGIAGAMAEHVGPLDRRTAYRRARTLPPVSQPVRARLGFLVCCYQNVAAPEATEATMRVLLANGYDLVVPPLACSGMPARTMGDRSAELDMAVRSVETLSELDLDGFVGDVASCTAQWGRHGELLATDRLLSAQAADISGRTWLSSALLAQVGLRAEMGPLRWKVAIDEPCSLPQEGPARAAARTLLGSVPHLRVVELEEAAMCCGGPGTYFHSQPERSEAILARKFDNVIASGAEVLVTENVSCITQLRAGARRHAPQVRVMHLFEVLLASQESARRRRPLAVDALEPATS